MVGIIYVNVLDGEPSSCLLSYDLVGIAVASGTETKSGMVKLGGGPPSSCLLSYGTVKVSETVRVVEGPLP